MADSHQLNVRISGSMMRRLRVCSVKQQLPMAVIVATALDRIIDEEGNPRPVGSSAPSVTLPSPATSS